MGYHLGMDELWEAVCMRVSEHWGSRIPRQVSNFKGCISISLHMCVHPRIPPQKASNPTRRRKNLQDQTDSGYLAAKRLNSVEESVVASTTELNKVKVFNSVIGIPILM